MQKPMQDWASLGQWYTRESLQFDRCFPSEKPAGWCFGCHEFYFPRNIGNVSSSQLTHMFQRGGPGPPTPMTRSSRCPPWSSWSWPTKWPGQIRMMGRVSRQIEPLGKSQETMGNHHFHHFLVGKSTKTMGNHWFTIFWWVNQRTQWPWMIWMAMFNSSLWV